MSRSASRAQDKIEERTKSPLVLSEQQLKNKVVFDQKAYCDVYHLLANMIDNLEDIFSEAMSEQDENKILENFVLQKQFTSLRGPVESDYID